MSGHFSGMHRPLRILCAEDNEMLGEVMLSVFAKAGHWVEHAGDGQLAWQRLANDLTDFDVVVTDHEMPRMNGLELVRRLREADFRGKIVVHSSAVGSNEIAQYRALGVGDIVQKGTRPEVLLAHLPSIAV
jgi:CheY-like chemotaxis protein